MVDVYPIKKNIYIYIYIYMWYMYRCAYGTMMQMEMT